MRAALFLFHLLAISSALNQCNFSLENPEFLKVACEANEQSEGGKIAVIYDNQIVEEMDVDFGSSWKISWDQARQDEALIRIEMRDRAGTTLFSSEDSEANLRVSSTCTVYSGDGEAFFQCVGLYEDGDYFELLTDEGSTAVHTISDRDCAVDFCSIPWLDKTLPLVRMLSRDKLLLASSNAPTQKREIKASKQTRPINTEAELCDFFVDGAELKYNCAGVPYDANDIVEISFNGTIFEITERCPEDDESCVVALPHSLHSRSLDEKLIRIVLVDDKTGAVLADSESEVQICGLLVSKSVNGREFIRMNCIASGSKGQILEFYHDSEIFYRLKIEEDSYEFSHIALPLDPYFDINLIQALVRNSTGSLIFKTLLGDLETHTIGTVLKAQTAMGIPEMQSILYSFAKTRRHLLQFMRPWVSKEAVSSTTLLLGPKGTRCDHPISFVLSLNAPGVSVNASKYPLQLADTVRAQKGFDALGLNSQIFELQSVHDDSVTLTFHNLIPNEHVIRVETIGHLEEEGSPPIIVFGEINLKIERKKTVLYLVLVYEEEKNRNFIPPRMAADSEAVLVACGRSKPDFLLPEEHWIPNTTFIECVNTVLERMDKEGMSLRVIQDRFKYLALVTNPRDLRVVHFDTWGNIRTHTKRFDSVPWNTSCPYDALEWNLNHFNPPIASTRGTAPTETTPFVEPGLGTFIGGVVACHTDLLKLVLPFLRPTGATWAFSASVFWATVKVMHAGRSLIFNSIFDAASRQTLHSFWDVHGEHSELSAERGLAMLWVMTGLASSEAMSSFLGDEKKLHISFITKNDEEGMARYHPSPDLFRPDHPVICGRFNWHFPCAEPPIPPASLWTTFLEGHRAVLSQNAAATKSSHESLLEILSQPHDTNRKPQYLPPPLRRRSSPLDPRCLASVFAAQGRIILRSQSPGEWIRSHNKSDDGHWRTLPDHNFSDELSFELKPQNFYCEKLSPSKICFVGDSNTRLLALEFGNVLGESAAENWDPKYGGSLSKCGGQVNVTYQWITFPSELGDALKSADSCNVMIANVGAHTVYQSALSTRQNLDEMDAKLNQMISGLRATLLGWASRGESAVPLLWTSIQPLYPILGPESWKSVLNSNSQTEKLRNLTSALLRGIGIQTLESWDLHLKLRRDEFQPDGMHCRKMCNGAKVAILTEFLLAGADECEKI